MRNHRATVHIFLLLLIPSLFILGPRQAHAEKDKDDKALIQLQMNNDMFFGSDEYFGSSSDLFYSDVTKPSGQKAGNEESTVVQPSSSGDSSNDSGSSGSGGSAPDPVANPDPNPTPEPDPVIIIAPPGGG